MTPNAINVRVADDGDAGDWNDYLARSEEGNFYQRYEWRGLNARVLGHETTYLMAGDGQRVTGVLPLVRVKSRLFGDILSSMPFVNFGGVAADDDVSRTALLEAACAHADEIGCDYLELRSDKPLGDLPNHSNKVSMTIDLESDPDAVWASFKSKHRNNIKSVQKSGVEVRIGGRDLLDPFFGLMCTSWRALGTPLYSKAYFEAVLEAFGDDGRVFVAYLDGKPIAGALNGHFRGTVEGMWAAMDPAFRKVQPNYVLYWEMIRDAAERGFTRYHLGRSTKDSPAVKWKARWKATPKPLYWSYHLVGAEELPSLNPDNPKFALAIRAWRRLPIPVTRIIGPPLARVIP